MIIGVRYLNKDTGELSARAYSYYCDIDDIKLGDMVVADTVNGQSIARVAELNVPESKIESFKDKVKTISQRAIINGDAGPSEVVGDYRVDGNRFSRAEATEEKTVDEVLDEIFGEA